MMESSLFSAYIQALAGCDEVEAVVLGGSRATGQADDGSDYDVYLYLNQPLALDKRRSLAAVYCRSMEFDNRFWETEDDGILKDGTAIEFIIRRLADDDAALRRTLVDCQPNNSYTTCLWYSLLNSQILFDRHGNYADLRRRYAIPYPGDLRNAIIERSRDLMYRKDFSYRAQIAKAIGRQDWFSVHHRVTELLASYFDLIFAFNCRPHPGEKKLQQRVQQECDFYPEHFSEDLLQILDRTAPGRTGLLSAITDLIGHLETMLAGQPDGRLT